MNRVPILHIMTNLSQADVCANENFEPSSQQCANKLKENEFMKLDQRLLANMTNLPSFAYCTEKDCSQIFPVRKARWTAQQILQRFP